jgi:hypothetical protein
MILKRMCQFCSGAIEFDDVDSIQLMTAVICPHCGKEILLNTSPMQSPRFFVWQQEKQQGPFDQETVQQMIVNGEIANETLLCPEDGGLDWTPAKELFLADSPPANLATIENVSDDLLVEIRVNPFQFLCYRPDRLSENALVEIRLTSGTDIRIKAMRFYDLKAMTAIDAKKTDARQKSHGVSTGLGSFGSLGWVLASSVVIGAVEGVLSSGAASQSMNLLVEANKMETALRDEGVFLPVGIIKNIEHPFREKWFAQVEMKNLAKEKTKQNSSVYALNEDEFLTVKTAEDWVCSIRWSAVESYTYHN